MGPRGTAVGSTRVGRGTKSLRRRSTAFLGARTKTKTRRAGSNQALVLVKVLI